jgi:hypothetical protein
VFDHVFGLPVHALVIHLVVVLGPLGALSAIAYAARPAWRLALKWPTLVLAVVTGVMSFVAAQSGEVLERRLLTTKASFDSPVGRLILAHASAGARMRLVGLVFTVVTLVVVLWALPATPAQRNVTDPMSPARSRPMALVAAAVLVLAGVGVLVQVTVTGHTGAKAVWSGIG